MSVAASVGPVTSCATTCAVPLVAPAVPLPVALNVAGPSLTVKKIGVFGITMLFASSAWALNVMASPVNTVSDFGLIRTLTADAPGPV